MFARAAIVGRVARERTEVRRQYLQQKQELKRRQPQLTFRQRCFIPFLRGPCMAVALGCFLLIIGAVMCNFAFHAKELSTYAVHTYNETVTETITNDSKFEALKSLTFIGPSLMGLGIFIIIIACVLLLDKRDRVLKDYIDGHNQRDLSIVELSIRAASADIAKQPKVKKPRKSKSYLEILERKFSGSSSKTSRARISSTPCLPSYNCDIKNNVETNHSQDVELAIINSKDVESDALNEASQSTQTNTYNTKLANDESHDNSAKLKLLAADW